MKLVYAIVLDDDAVKEYDKAVSFRSNGLASGWEQIEDDILTAIRKVDPKAQLSFEDVEI